MLIEFRGFDFTGKTPAPNLKKLSLFTNTTDNQ